MIRDRPIVRLRESILSEKLQLNPELTLEKPITQVHQAKTVKQQQPLLRGESNHKPLPDTPIGTMHKNKRLPYLKHLLDSRSQNIDKEVQVTCSCCGKSPFHD